MNYRIIALFALSASLTACASSHTPLPPPTGAGDLSYLITADPNTVTDAALATHAEDTEAHFVSYHLVNGIVFQGYRDKPEDDYPTYYGGGGDSLLFTGFRLAGCIYRYKVRGLPADLDKVQEGVRGLYILTHATGTPGVLCRSAFPAGREAEWHFPAAWQGRIANGFVNTGPALDDPFNPGTKMTPMTYYTRVTRDQVTGLLYGLGVFLHEMTGTDPATQRMREVVASIVEDTYNYLEANDFTIVDERGKNDTYADTVDGLLKLQLLAVYRHSVAISHPARQAQVAEDYESAREGLLGLGFYLGDIFNRMSNSGQLLGLKTGQYYAWNLRFGRLYTIWLLESDASKRREIFDYFAEWIWQHVAGHKNAFFTLTHDAMAQTLGPSEGVWALRSWTLRPFRNWCSPVAIGTAHEHTPPSWFARTFGLADDAVLPPHLRDTAGYWQWQSDPWEAGYSEPSGQEENMGLDFFLPYWLGRFYGFIPGA